MHDTGLSVDLVHLHALRAHVHGLEVLVKLLLAHPEQPILRHLRLELSLDLGKLLPARRESVDVGPHPFFELARAPRVPHLNQVHAATRDVGERLKHGVRVPVDDTVVFHRVELPTRGASDDEIFLVPRDYLSEELLADDGTLAAATHGGPVLLPHRRLLPFAAVLKFVVEVALFVVVAPAGPLSRVLSRSLLRDRVLVFTTGEHRPRARRDPALDVVPAAAVCHERLLQVTRPELAVHRRFSAEEGSRVLWVSREPLVHHHVHRAPCLQIVQSHVVPVRSRPGHLVHVRGILEQLEDGAVELGERGDGGEQPAVAHAALVDVAGVHVLDDLDPRSVQYPHAAAGTDGRVGRAVDQRAAVGHLHRHAVVDGLDVHPRDVRKGLVICEFHREDVAVLVLETLGALALDEGVPLLVCGPVHHVALVHAREVLGGVGL
mmetsp:Transcript_6877/g.31010  ORF Transcript_6877/g.31010 Transcript_6877/m.31010 type:complete len:435 (+) Transcript_6877:315-1619(+)